MDSNLVTTLRGTLPDGVNAVLDRNTDQEIGLDFAVVRVAAGTRYEHHDARAEVAVLVITGEGELTVDGESLGFARAGWIEGGPAVAHGPAGARFSVVARTACEVAIVGTENAARFAARIYAPKDVPDEHRGKGMLDDTSYRIVRCAFDRKNAPPEARLVLGEVITMPGRWSSYPPHHHPQPEIYYYRFEPSHGFGHGECGDTVYKLQHHDVLKIPAGRDHAQVAAPGYHMYYLWAIRHLPDRPYDGFEYAPEHEGLLAAPKAGAK